MNRPFSNNKIISYNDYNKQKLKCKQTNKNNYINSQKILELKCFHTDNCADAPLTIINGKTSYIYKPLTICKPVLYPYGYYLCNTNSNKCLNAAII